MQLYVILAIIAVFRQTSAAGGISNINVKELRTNEALRDVFKKTIDEYNKQINSEYAMVPYEVHSISSQVVAGILYRFEVTMVGSKCKMTEEEKTLLNCKFHDSITPVKAQLSLVVAPWENPQFSYRLVSQQQSDNLRLHDQLYVLGIHDGESVSGLNFQRFKEKYGKSYEGAEEDSSRHAIYTSNFKKALLMRMLDQGTAEYGETEFSDMTIEEFTASRLSPSGPWDLTKMPSRRAPIPRINPPPTVDWRTRGAVSEVKNQGQCGSCWAFSTTGNVEGQWFLRKKQLISLSEQELVDCDKVDQGCNGGLPSQAYKAIEKLGGLEQEASYPYTGKAAESCKLEKSKLRVYINDSVTVDSNESQMAAWTSINGPISIGINANAMQFYHGGISHPFSFLCNKSHLDHGVLIVGYSITAAKEPYWIIKNSWGPSWGEKGYYLVFRGSGVCGLNKMPTSAVVH